MKLDKKGGNIRFGDVGRVEMGLLRRDFGLVDVYRKRSSNERQFTWECGSGHDKTQCRLDRFYVKAKLCDKVTSFVHSPIVHSITDHHLPYFDLSCNSDTIGPSYWKCNISVLKDVHLKDIRSLWERELKLPTIINSKMWHNFKLQ